MRISIRDSAELVEVNPQSPIRNGFTLVELLVVIGIIVLLVGILIPVVGRVRMSAQEAAARSQMSGLQGAIERYYQDFKGYPGPFGNDVLGNDTASEASFLGGALSAGFSPSAPSGSGFDVAPTNTHGSQWFTRITGSENLVLGLLGGLRAGTGGQVGELIYDPSEVGKGPASLNPANPKRYAPYIEAKDLSFRDNAGKKTGHFKDDSAAADDTLIPEFVDKFSAGPMPILYLRAKPGSPGIVDDMTGTTTPPRQYSIRHILGYTRDQGTDSYIGMGRDIPKGSDQAANRLRPHGLRTELSGSGSFSGFTELTKPPYALDLYLASPSANTGTISRGAGTPRQKDGYILISAGRDRVYGTNDDITNFGPVR